MTKYIAQVARADGRAGEQIEVEADDESAAREAILSSEHMTLNPDWVITSLFVEV